MVQASDAGGAGVRSVDSSAFMSSSSTRMCQVSNTGRVSVWEVQGEAEEPPWSMQASWTVPEGKAQQAVMCHPACGSLLAVAAGGDGTASSVSIWAEVLEARGPAWRLAHQLGGREGQVAALAFAPPAHGLLLAIARADGFLSLYKSRPLRPASWRLDSELLAERDGACTCLCWRAPQPQEGLPPLLLVGTSTGAKVFWHSARLTQWRLSCALRDAGGGGCVAAVDWGSGGDGLVAVASGREVTLHRVSGSASKLEAVLEARLGLPSPAWQLRWNHFGTWLAVSLAGEARVQLWRRDLVGDWVVVAQAAGAGRTQESGLVDN